MNIKQAQVIWNVHLIKELVCIYIYYVWNIFYNVKKKTLYIFQYNKIVIYIKFNINL